MSDFKLKHFQGEIIFRMCTLVLQVAQADVKNMQLNSDVRNS
jgi:hypothetical protein